MDLISRQAVKEQMIKYGFHAPDITVTEFVEDLPSVNPQKTGRWLMFEKLWYQCSECCALRENKGYLEHYCPNCGANMQEE